MTEQAKGSLRGVMPQVAQVVDEMRQVLGKEWADRIVAGGQAGRGTFYAWEVGPDGVLRDFGSWHGGQRVQVVDGQVVPPPRPKGVPVDLCVAGTRRPKVRGER